MWGQWVGEIKGDLNGFATINIDKDCKNKGKLLFSGNKISFYADAVITLNRLKFEIKISNIETYPYNTSSFIYEEFTLIGRLDQANDLKGVMDLGDKKRDFNLMKLDTISEEIPLTTLTPWRNFKQDILDLKRKNPGLIFRGQENSKFKLETTFHRQNRRDLIRYGSVDIIELQRHLTASLNRSFNLQFSNDYSDLLYIAQHHGYPTPLLDWTESPFVAAFFAFHKLAKDSFKGSIRIYIFDKENWIKDIGTKIYTIDEPNPCVSPLVITSMNNARALPQQSLVTFSNIGNIESFIKHKEKENNKTYLTVYDISYSDRNDAMKDLEIMGITAASLFSGLDGICSALKEKQF